MFDRFLTIASIGCAVVVAACGLLQIINGDLLEGGKSFFIAAGVIAVAVKV